MFETAVLLVVTLYTPEDRHGQVVWRQEYQITENTQEAKDAAGDLCVDEARPWVKMALRINRGHSMLDVACDVQNEEAEPAKGHE